MQSPALSPLPLLIPNHDVPAGAAGMKPWANRGMATAIRRLQHFIILAASEEDDFCDECVVWRGGEKRDRESEKRCIV
jgi:hypothetical protein